MKPLTSKREIRAAGLREARLPMSYPFDFRRFMIKHGLKVESLAALIQFKNNSVLAMIIRGNIRRVVMERLRGQYADINKYIVKKPKH